MNENCDAAQLVDVQGDVKHLVEVRLNVISPAVANALPSEHVLELESNEIKELEDKTNCYSEPSEPEPK